MMSNTANGVTERFRLNLTRDDVKKADVTALLKSHTNGGTMNEKKQTLAHVIAGRRELLQACPQDIKSRLELALPKSDKEMSKSSADFPHLPHQRDSGHSPGENSEMMTTAL
jgi:hypothetical protein